MLVIPFDRPIDWRRPPVVTLTLVLVNVLVYLLFQLDDGRELMRVKKHYYESGLAAIELPHFRDFLERQGDSEAFLERYGDRIGDPATPWFMRVITSSEFTRRLEAGKVITPGDPHYSQWRNARTALERRLDHTTVWGHGLIPAKSEPSTFLTHMFLHGGWLHLIGNMIFLIAVGLLVEVALGSSVLLGLYLLGGLGAAGLFIAMHPASVTPMIGASGAIAGLMGLCSVLYGLRRIRFFYFIGVYGDYVKAPALVLLGLWLGMQVFQYLFAGSASVAYTAHIGGLITGAVAGAAVRFGTNAVDEEALDEPGETEAFERQLGEAHERLQAMEPERARPLFERMAREYPGNTRVLDGLFRACRFAPASEAYHDVVKRILALDGADTETAELKLAALRDYRERARPKPRIASAQLPGVIDLLLRRGSAREAAAPVQTALKHPERFPRIGDDALRLARKYQRDGEREHARTVYRRILECCPGTSAAHHAERALTGIAD